MVAVRHQVNVYAAKTHLSELLARVEKGEEIVVARNGVPVARLVPIQAGAKKPARRVGGSMRGQISWEPGTFDSLSPEEQAAYEAPIWIGEDK